LACGVLSRDRHINVERVVHMFRVATALLLAAAALAAVDLSGLVDEMYNTTSPLERFAPTYVFEVDGCRVLVYVADPTLENSPLTARKRDADYFTHDTVGYYINKTLRPLTSAEAEKLLDALFQVLGPSATAVVAVRSNSALWYRDLRVEARSAAQLAEETRKAVKADFYLGAAEAYEALKRGARQVAYLSLVKWRHGDLAVVFAQSDTSASVEVKTTSLTAAVEALEKAREAAGEVWNSVRVALWHGPYFVPAGTVEALTEAAQRLGEEVRGVWGYILVLSEGEVGPVYVAFPYPSGTAPDEATAERIVRRFVELSSFCKSPLVVEFWAKRGYELALIKYSQLLWPFAVEVAVAVTVGLLVLTRRRK